MITSLIEIIEIWDVSLDFIYFTNARPFVRLLWNGTKCSLQRYSYIVIVLHYVETFKWLHFLSILFYFDDELNCIKFR